MKKLFLVGAALILFVGKACAVEGLRASIDFPKQDKVQLSQGVVGIIPKVTNISTQEIKIRCWSCSYWENWVSDNRLVEIKMWGCRSNAPGVLTLLPGQTKEFPMTVQVSVGDAVTFKMAFQNVGPPMSLDKDEILDKEPVWSDSATIKISNGELTIA